MLLQQRLQARPVCRADVAIANGVANQVVRLEVSLHIERSYRALCNAHKAHRAVQIDWNRRAATLDAFPSVLVEEMRAAMAALQRRLNDDETV